MRKKPMLAYPASAKPIDYSKPIFIQPKLDGVRCVIQAEPWVTNEASGYDIVAYSRTGKEWKNINELVPLNFASSKNLKRTGKAGILSGALDLVKEGNISIKQKKLFDDIFIKENK